MSGAEVHFSRWMILASSAVCAVSILFSYLDTPTGSTNGIDGGGWRIVFFVALPVLLSVLGDRAEGFRPPLALLAIISASLGLLFAVWKVVDAGKAADIATSIAGSGSIGIGAWILLGGAVVLVTGAAATLSRRVAGG